MGKYGKARQATDDNIIGRIRIAYWVSKGKTLIILIIVVFLMQQRLHERAPVLRCTYIACVVI